MHSHSPPGGVRSPKPLLQRQTPPSGHRSVAVLIDGSAVFFGVRSLFPEQTLDYRALIAVLCDRVPGLHSPRAPDCPDWWVMWTSASTDNAGQQKFLEFAERDLGFTVRRVSPIDSYVVEPTLLGSGVDQRTANRLIRFDSSIAFALGRIAETHRVVVVSDSFSLAEPLLRLATLPSSPRLEPPILAFFGRALDTRWPRAIRGSKVINFLDLDEYERDLFGGKEVTRHSRDDDKLPF